MTYRLYAYPFFIAMTSAFCSVAHAADSLRCGGSLVQVGDNKARVIKICGEPYLQDNYCKPLQVPERQRRRYEEDYPYDPPCENVETWTYDQGSGTFLKTVEFQRGKVVDIIYGPRS